MENSKSNEYYNHGKVETIDAIEELITREALPRDVAYHVAQAQKYIGRLGLKDPNYKSDLKKALNYLHRALYGVWFPFDE